jgi:hypothetical protein
MDKHGWKEQAACLGWDSNFFFDKYEEDQEGDFRKSIDSLCSGCPVATQCFAVGISQKEWGVWGGVYLENGNISRELNRHKTRSDWAETWQYLTLDKKQ